MRPLHICPVKQLYLMQEELRSSAAVLCTMNPFSEKRLLGLKYIHVEFADVTDSKRRDAFTAKQAQYIKDFIDKQSGAAALYICCDSGESRSAAIAAAVLRYFGKSDLAIWKNAKYHPNPYVYRLQCRAFGLGEVRLRAAILSRYNRWMFKRALRKHK